MRSTTSPAWRATRCLQCRRGCLGALHTAAPIRPSTSRRSLYRFGTRSRLSFSGGLMGVRGGQSVSLSVDILVDVLKPDLALVAGCQSLLERRDLARRDPALPSMDNPGCLDDIFRVGQWALGRDCRVCCCGDGHNAYLGNRRSGRDNELLNLCLSARTSAKVRGACWRLSGIVAASRTRCSIHADRKSSVLRSLQCS